MEKTKRLKLPIWDSNDIIKREEFNNAAKNLENSLLKNSTAALFGLDENAVPDDAFRVIATSYGRYKIKLHLTFEGRAFSGVAVGGITTASGGTVSTDTNGLAEGYTYEPSGTLSVPQVCLDIPAFTIPYNTNGNLLTEITHDAKTDSSTKQVEVTESGNFRLSPAVTAFDAFLVGGGGSGAVCVGERRACSGAGGGYTNTLLDIENDGSEFTATIGAGGVTNMSSTGASNGNTGGATTLTHNGATLATADGGKRGTYSNIDSATAYRTAAGGDGGSGGGCGYVGRYGGRATDGGSDGSNGADNTYNTTVSGGTGQGTTTRAFGESSGKLYCGGGGAAAVCDDGDADSFYSGYGGDGGGADGVKKTSTNASNAVSAATAYGGGGGGCVQRNSSYYAKSTGYQGVVILRWE